MLSTLFRKYTPVLPFGLSLCIADVLHFTPDHPLQIRRKEIKNWPNAGNGENCVNIPHPKKKIPHPTSVFQGAHPLGSKYALGVQSEWWDLKLGGTPENGAFYKAIVGAFS